MCARGVPLHILFPVFMHSFQPQTPHSLVEPQASTHYAAQALTFCCSTCLSHQMCNGVGLPFSDLNLKGLLTAGCGLDTHRGVWPASILVPQLAIKTTVVGRASCCHIAEERKHNLVPIRKPTEICCNFRQMDREVVTEGLTTSLQEQQLF